ncbi:acyl carrier protein [Lentzea sp. CC55]|uniref:acyl carrier protein n=1 Tax=Lentzea sp. CC55 TaxID=2884909 RepID=UPI001F2F5F78|nr:acyl carrier protein [Lentzea sp. CC55]MCG8927330.1 hypothetical protein [Lentzea sp. CC55]
MITEEDVMTLIADILGQSVEEFDADAEVALDSLFLVWLVHKLQQRVGSSLQIDFDAVIGGRTAREMYSRLMTEIERCGGKVRRASSRP